MRLATSLTPLFWKVLAIVFVSVLALTAVWIWMRPED
jgi:hypothetical protein